MPCCYLAPSLPTRGLSRPCAIYSPTRLQTVSTLLQVQIEVQCCSDTCYACAVDAERCLSVRGAQLLAERLYWPKGAKPCQMIHVLF